MILALVAPPPAQPARGRGQAACGGSHAVIGGGQLVRGLLRGRGHSGRALSHFYAFQARPEVESSDAVITCIILVCHRDASVVFDPCFTYLYVSSNFTSYLDTSHDSLSYLVYVSTHVGDSIIVDPLYRACLVTIESDETKVDLILLDMVDFDVIMGMD
ncbi:uncharacterized protein [Nicotiana tomentosiformis]|uniref:uncharacterized protein n=1 Tax=Nicotiana tomentosiformis TaxID=4098 RepID=UPI00388CA091